MYFDDFKRKYNNKGVDYDGYYGNQCVDLFRQFNKEVLGIEQPKGVRGAKNFWTNYKNDKNLYNNFTRIANTPTFVPQKGDVAIWYYGTYGHIALCTGKGNVDTFEVLEQNKPLNSVCHLQNENYNGFYGVLRPKNQDKIEPQARNYRCNYNMKVRDGVWGNHKLKSQLSADGQKHCIYGDYGTYAKGTVFTAKGFVAHSDGSLWAISPSGYICIEDKNGVYCTRV